MNNIFDKIKLVPTDTTMLLNQQFIEDTRPNKINMGIGVYCDENGKIPLLKCVQLSEKKYLSNAPARGYPPTEGLSTYTTQVQKLMFGKDSEVIKNKCVATTGTIAGTGAVRIGADLLYQNTPSATVYISDPSWPNHLAIFKSAGFNVKEYPYYNYTNKDFDFDGMIAKLKTMNPNDIVVLHACCHNPTGIDPTKEQWEKIIEVLKDKQLTPFVDMAYLGFAKSVEEDNILIKMLVKAEMVFLATNSFSKSMSLYGERVGALSVVTKTSEEAVNVLSHIKNIIRSNYSCPSTYGENVIAGILGDEELTNMWLEELDGMRVRMIKMRELLIKNLAEKSIDISFAKKENGLFSLLNLNKAQIDRLRDEYAIYALPSGRICMAGLTEKNVEHVSSCIKAVMG